MICVECQAHCERCKDELFSHTIDHYETRIMQIMPAPGWRAIYGSLEREYSKSPLAWGVTQGGTVIPLIVISDGSTRDARDDENFRRVQHEDVN